MAKEQSPFLTLGKVTYYILFDSPAGVLPPSTVDQIARLDEDLIPATAIEWTGTSFGPSDLESVRREFETRDDVWSADFLSRES